MDNLNNELKETITQFASELAAKIIEQREQNAVVLSGNPEENEDSIVDSVKAYLRRSERLGKRRYSTDFISSKK